MNYKKFDSSDINRNIIKTYPENNIMFFSGSVYINSLNQISSSNQNNSFLLAGNPVNFLASSNQYKTSYFLNAVNGSSFPFVPLNITDTERYSKTTLGEQVSYSRITSSVSCQFLTSDSLYFKALKNTLEWYSSVSPAYKVSNFENKNFALINIPSIFYGSTIKRGSVKLSYHYTGTLVSQIEDFGSDGKLVETVSPTITGSTAGVVLYDEGLILLSGSWDLPSSNTTKWNLFSSASTPQVYSSGSFNLEFKGTNYIPSITMLAHAEKNEFNTTNNKTWLDHDQGDFIYIVSSSNSYKESEKILIKNTVYNNYDTVSGSFKKQTFISKIGVYDENHNLIAIAKLATPVKKNNERDYTFKLKLDM